MSQIETTPSASRQLSPCALSVIARVQDLVVPVLGMYAGQFLLARLPQSPPWGYAILAASVALLILRAQPILSPRVADIWQIMLGIVIELPLALNTDAWRFVTPWWQLVALWLFCCGVVGFAIVRQSPHAIKLGLPPWQRVDRIDLIVIGLLLITALLARFPNLETLPPRIDVDEPTWAHLAIDSATGGANDPFGTGWVTHPTLQFFIEGIFIQNLGRTFFAMRLLSVFAGTFAVLVIYLLARRVCNRRVAIIAGVLAVASNTWIHFSRLGVNNITDVFFFALVFALFWSAGASGKPVVYALAGACLGLSLYYYFGARAIPFIVIANLGVWILADRQGVLQSWTLLLTFFVMSVVVAMPLLGTWILHPKILTDRLDVAIPFSPQLSQEAISAHTSIADLLLRRVITSLLVFVSTADNGGFYNPGQALLHPIEAPFFLIGLLIILKNWRQPVNQGILAWMLVNLILGSVLITIVASFHRILGVLPAAILVLAIGIDAAVATLTRYVPLSSRLQAPLTLALVAVIAGVDLHYYFSIYAAQPPKQSPDEFALNIAALEYEHLHGEGQFVLYLRDGSDQTGKIFSEPIRYVSTNNFLGAVPQVLDQLDRDQPIYFYIFPNVQEQLPIVLSRFPGGTLQEYRRKADGMLMMTRYTIGASDQVSSCCSFFSNLVSVAPGDTE